MLLVREYLAAGIVHIEVELAARGKLLDHLSQLLKCVEKANATTSIEIVRLNQPHVATVIHLIIESEIARHYILVLGLRVNILAILNESIYLLQFTFTAAYGWLAAHALNRIEISAEAVYFVNEVLGCHIEDKLDGQILEHVQLVLLTVAVHVRVQLILRS